MIKANAQANAAQKGLYDAQVAESRRLHGENSLTKRKPKSFLLQFLSNLNDPVIRILLCAMAVKLILMIVLRSQDWVETAGIAVAVLLASLISTLSERGSARAFERLSEESAKVSCRVFRNGVICERPISELVVGDIVPLSAGELIPADGYLLSGKIRTDQSAMTGENREVEKTPSDTRRSEPSAPNALFRGCTVTSGACEMEIAAVGDATFLGQISREIQLDPRQSPLKLRLSKLARQISRLGYVAAVLVALAYLFNAFVLDSGMNATLISLKLTNLAYLFSQLFHAFTLALTVLVVAVPEGLPMMIAVVLSSNVKKMVRDQVLVRKPVGLESAGSMNILFTDKTGTLTEGCMKVSGFLDANGNARPFPQQMRDGGLSAECLALAFRFCNDAAVGYDDKGTPQALGGNATERALLDAVLPFPEPRGYHTLARLPFDSTKKYSAVSLGGKTPLTLIMGAPEKLFPYIRNGMHGDSVGFFSRTQVERSIRERAAKGERLLAVAVSQENIPATSHASSIRGSLTLVGVVCISDPLRAEAAHSVAELQDAGIHVVMITGDNRETAEYLARCCGILNHDHDLVLTSDELAKLSDHRLCELLPRIAVIARALPTDKSRLVRISQELEMVTGMTGDGINDAPALRRADVGFSMGSGTQVAKDAGDIIIMDNNLASICRAVLYGRNIFKSIRKFITLQLTMNFCAVAVTMICPFLGIDSPVTVVQMLWINMIMDTLGGLAFAGEPALPECMREKPKRRDEPILNRYIVNEILLLGGFTVGLYLFFLKSPTVSSVFRAASDRIYHLTAFFALFIFSSVFNCFNARTDRLKLTAGLKKNAVFLVIMTAILAVQIGFTYLGGSVLRTAPLTLRELLLTAALSLTVFPAEIIRKALWRLRGRHGGY